MQYYLRSCKVVGIQSPHIIIEGLVSTDVEQLFLVSGTQLIWRKKFEKRNDRVYGFSLNEIVPNGKCLRLIAKTDREVILLKKIRTNFDIRIRNKILGKIKRTDKWEKISVEYMEANTLDVKLYDPFDGNEYRKWLCKNENVNNEKREWQYEPLISIIIPVYNINRELLSECIESVLRQTYQNLEICIADDHSTNEETVATLKEYENYSSKIKVCYRNRNGHISEASNSAIEMAEGEFIGFLDNDDILVESALEEVVNVLNQNKECDMIYTDEDKLDGENRCEPHFKPDFAIDNFLTSNYICHFCVIRTELIKKIGGFRKGYEGAQDYDLFLRISEKTDKIYHIPKLLYRWRKIKGSTSIEGANKSYASLSGKKALEEYLQRNNIDGKVDLQADTIYCISYILHRDPKVEVVVLYEGGEERLQQFIWELLSYTKNIKYRIVIIGSNKKLQKKIMEFQRYVRIRFIGNIEKFNEYSAITDSDHFLFVNENVGIIEPNWMRTLLSYVEQPVFGAVASNMLNRYTKEFCAGYIIGDQHRIIPVKTGYIALGYAPTNRCIVSQNAFFVSKEHFREVGGFSPNLEHSALYIDLQIKLFRKYRRNIVVSQTYCLQEEPIRWETELPEIKELNDFDQDYSYNPNFSLKVAYKL